MPRLSPTLHVIALGQIFKVFQEMQLFITYAISYFSNIILPSFTIVSYFLPIFIPVRMLSHFSVREKKIFPVLMLTSVFLLLCSQTSTKHSIRVNKSVGIFRSKRNTVSVCKVACIYILNASFVCHICRPLL